MIGFADFLLIVAISALAAGLVCGAGVLALRLSRAASLTVQLVVLVGATVLSVVAATLAIAFQMYISPHDLVVLIWVIGVAAGHEPAGGLDPRPAAEPVQRPAAAHRP